LGGYIGWRGPARAELDELSPAGVQLKRMLTRASAGFPDQANKFPDGSN
jgi:hypothetical protein